MTLESQYKEYMLKNPESTFTYDEWLSWWGLSLKEAIEQLEEEKADHKKNQENNS